MDARKNEQSFQYLYGEFCRIHNSPILYRVNVFVHLGVLDFYGDGINKSDWRPILQALNFDRCLHFVSIRSKELRRHIISRNGSKILPCEANMKAIPRSILTKVAITLKDYLNVSTNLTGLELDGLHLTKENLLVLSKGLSRSSSLQSISLRRCLIGDGGCQVICSALRNQRTITSIDFSACEITAKGAFYVSQLLQHQNLNRFNENWLQSLRYRTPNPEKMPGLLRVTLSHNKIGDHGAQHIIQILHDDCWLKGMIHEFIPEDPQGKESLAPSSLVVRVYCSLLDQVNLDLQGNISEPQSLILISLQPFKVHPQAVDMQNCNLTEETGQSILQLLELNDIISILDVRNNNLMSPNTITAIIVQLTSRRSQQFEWCQDGPTCLPRTASRTTVSLTGLRKANGVRKTTSNVFPPTNKALGDPRTCSSTPNMNARGTCSNSHLRKCASSSKAQSLSHVGALQKHLEYLRQQLGEEVARRKEAEATRDKAQSRLESHLQELADTEAAISGRVLVDKNVIQQVNSAFSDVNQLLALMGGTSVDKCQNFSAYSSFQESSNTKTSFSAMLKCYDDEPTSMEASDANTSGIATDGVKYRSPNEGQGDCFLRDEVDNLSSKLKSIGNEEGDSSTSHNSCTDKESKTIKSFSDESDPSWITVASRSVVQV